MTRVRPPEDESWQTPPMFDLDAAAAAARTRAAAARRIAERDCPACGMVAALVMQNGHAVWRSHTAARIGGRYPVRCKASGTRACQEDSPGHSLAAADLCRDPLDDTRGEPTA